MRSCAVYGKDDKLIKELALKIQENMTLNQLKDAISYYMKINRARLKLITRDEKKVVDSHYDNVLVKNASIVYGIIYRREIYGKGTGAIG